MKTWTLGTTGEEPPDLIDLEAMDLPVCPVLVQSRVFHLDAMSRGQSAADWALERAAAKELQDLWQWAARELGMPPEGTEQEGEVL